MLSIWWQAPHSAAHCASQPLFQATPLHADRDDSAAGWKSWMCEVTVTECCQGLLTVTSALVSHKLEMAALACRQGGCKASMTS